MIPTMRWRTSVAIRVDPPADSGNTWKVTQAVSDLLDDREITAEEVVCIGPKIIYCLREVVQRPLLTHRIADGGLNRAPPSFWSARRKQGPVSTRPVVEQFIRPSSYSATRGTSEHRRCL